MLNMGFREDIETILTDTSADRQTVMFSATMAQPILHIAKTHQNNAKMIKVVKKELTVANIEQYYFEVRQTNKEEICQDFLTCITPIFHYLLQYQEKGRRINLRFTRTRVFCGRMHGDLKQQQRDRVMESFRNGKTEILIATDVAARGHRR